MSSRTVEFLLSGIFVLILAFGTYFYLHPPTITDSNSLDCPVSDTTTECSQARNENAATNTAPNSDTVVPAKPAPQVLGASTTRFKELAVTGNYPLTRSQISESESDADAVLPVLYTMADILRSMSSRYVADDYERGQTIKMNYPDAEHTGYRRWTR